MIRVLTVARQFGSGGSAIARLVAEQLKWRVIDPEIIDEVVRMAHVDRAAAERCDERLDPVFHRMLKSLWQGGFETSTTDIYGDIFDSETMSRCSRVVIEQSAEAGNCVIVGRGGQCILRDREDTLHVFIWAPRAHRIRRIHERRPDEKDPESLMDKIDRERGAYVRREFDANGRDHTLYDLMINSAMGDDIAARCIVTAISGTDAKTS